MKISGHRSYSSWLRKPVSSGPYRPWLLDNGSLTRRLQLASTRFAVKPLPTSGSVLPEELPPLRLTPRQKALVREVFLCCNGQPAVFAHSVLPYESLQGAWRHLSGLGSKPLGAALFSNPRVERTPLEFRKLTRNHRLYKVAQLHVAQLPTVLWARRSVFSLDASAIMVTEIFLPQVLTL